MLFVCKLGRSTRASACFHSTMETQTFGRHQFSVSQVLAIQRRTGLRGLFRPGFDVFVRGGFKLRLSHQEKLRLDQALSEHQKVLGVVATIEQFKRANRPRG